MELISQVQPIQQLTSLANQDRHSLLIEGPSGSGKTYIAKQFAAMITTSDFQVIAPKVQDIKDTITACYQINTPIVLCIENLDIGVSAASYALLKFLEEPAPHVYIVITCRNVQHVPDTIVSRSTVITTAPPTPDDVEQYAMHCNNSQYELVREGLLWKCVKSFKDVDSILKLTDEHRDYILSIPSLLSKPEAISSLLWNLQKYPDGTATPIDLVIRYIMCNNNNTTWQAAHTCLQQLADGRVATHAILAKFLFDYKYLQ